jgi:hypothetical protein
VNAKLSPSVITSPHSIFAGSKDSLPPNLNKGEAVVKNTLEVTGWVMMAAVITTLLVAFSLWHVAA